MKVLFYIVVVMLFFLQANAQENIPEPIKREIHIGLDIFQSIPPFLIGKKYFIQNAIIIEPSIRIEGKRPRKSFVFSPGFTSGSTNKNSYEFISYEKFQGFYMKMGYETRNANVPMSIGFGPVISFASFKGRYKFEGPAFGDYEGDFTKEKNVAIGMNGYLTYDLKFSEKMFMRFLLQGTVAFRNGKINPYYYPGLGRFLGLDKLFFSPGLTAQLYFKVR